MAIVRITSATNTENNIMDSPYRISENEKTGTEIKTFDRPGRIPSLDISGTVDLIPSAQTGMNKTWMRGHSVQYTKTEDESLCLRTYHPH